MTEKQKIDLARIYFKEAIGFFESGMVDEIYSIMDPEEKFSDEELTNEFNFDTIQEVIRLGFVAKYGECL